MEYLGCMEGDFQVHFNLTNSSLIDSDPNVPKAMQLGALTGVSIALLIDVLMSIELNTAKCGFKIFSEKHISKAFVAIVMVISLPVVAILISVMWICKGICAVLIKRRDKYFVSFLDCFDVFWSLEDDTSKSIINVLGVINSESPIALADSIKDKLREITLNKYCQKIFYRRREKYGFYYWRKYSVIDVDEYVEIVKLPNKDHELNKADLESLMTELQETTLPYSDEGLFKILITSQSIGSHNETRKDYGIIFRIHHSVGDGVALIEFICKSFADSSSNCPINMFSFPESCNHDSPTKIFEMMRILFEMPICFIEGILRKPDESALHGPSLRGKKWFKWTESDEDLLKMIKNVKENVEQFNFTDVLLTSLSKGLRDFLSKKKGPVPDELAVVIPVRFPKSTQEDKPLLKNDFSVTILDVPLKQTENMIEINKRCRMLRKSADPLTNFYFLKLVCNVFPSSILRPLLNSSQATMVFSNMPGPNQISISGGNLLKSMVFFVPHKGTTGLGVTVLCYGGVLRFAAMADEALVSSSSDLAIILEGMVEEIRRLHAVYGKN